MTIALVLFPHRAIIKHPNSDEPFPALVRDCSWNIIHLSESKKCKFILKTDYNQLINQNNNEYIKCILNNNNKRFEWITDLQFILNNNEFTQQKYSSKLNNKRTDMVNLDGNLLVSSIYNSYIDHCIRPIGIAAPRLKDYKFIETETNNEIYKCYLQIIKYMRLLYWKCNLIHGDLSEYNILYYNNLQYIIDVSQSVEPSHPNSYHFLSIDCENINDFFRKHCIMTLTDLKLFEYILDERRMKNNKKYIKNENNENEQWNDVIDINLLNKIENICKQRWDKCININENSVNDCVEINHMKTLKQNNLTYKYNTSIDE